MEWRQSMTMNIKIKRILRSRLLNHSFIDNLLLYMLRGKG